MPRAGLGLGHFARFLRVRNHSVLIGLCFGRTKYVAASIDAPNQTHAAVAPPSGRKQTDGALPSEPHFENGLGHLTLSAYWQSIIRGAFLLLVVVLQARLQRRPEADQQPVSEEVRT